MDGKSFSRFFGLSPTLRLVQSLDAHSGAVYGLAQRPDQKGGGKIDAKMAKLQTHRIHGTGIFTYISSDFCGKWRQFLPVVT